MALTEKQERFCRNIVSGLSGKDSYISAYDTNCNNQVAYNEASKLLLREDIQKRIADIRKPLEEAVQIDALNERQKRIAYIENRIAICEKKEDEQALIRWNDMLCKILSLYKETENTETQENNVTQLDITALKKLSGAS